MQGWVFYDDQQGTACGDTNVCRMVAGPAGQPAGQGSAELATTVATDGKALILAGFQGVRFDQITELRYATYRQTADPGNNLAIALQFNADFDLNDAATGYQGRLVFEPYQGVGGNVKQNVWQDWDAKAGKWWGTRATVVTGNASTPNTCVQPTPCTWDQLISAFPNVGVHSTYGAVILKAGSSWPAFRGNVDNLRITVATTATVYDFELTPPVPALPPDSVPRFTTGGVVSGALLGRDSVERGVVIVQFWPNTSQPARQTAIDAIHGSVIGGLVVANGDGFYYVRVPDDGTASSVASALTAMDTTPQVELAMPAEPNALRASSRGAIDGHPDFRIWSADPARADGLNWGLERIQTPNAWGCTTGSAEVKIGVIDNNPDTLTIETIRNPTRLTDLSGNTIFVSNVRSGGQSPHGRSVASVAAARGNDSVGMTGVMWKASLILQDRASSAHTPNAPMAEWERGDSTLSPSIAGLEEQIYMTGVAGADVIVMSLNRFWNHTPVSGNPNDERLNSEPGDVLSAALRRLQNSTPSRRPLIIVSAGNNKISARWSGWLTAQANFPDQVLVVGASDKTNARWVDATTGEGSNSGSYVDVYAPGAGVGATAARNSQPDDVEPVSGTSFAAPMVAGVAGLLKSFDPRLTSAEIRQLILDGAAADGQGIQIESGKYLLNAYESLRRAARRIGSPLCGNRVFVDSVAQVVVERRTGPNPSDYTDERIAAGDFSPGYVTITQFLHDGRYIDLFDSDQNNWTLEYRYSDYSWHRISGDYDSSMARIPSFSRPNYGASHSYRYDPARGITWDTVLVLRQRGPPYEFDIVLQYAGGETVIKTLTGVATGSAYPLRFDELLVAVAPANLLGQEQKIIGVNLRTNAEPRTVWTRPAGSLTTWLTPTESGEEFVLAYLAPHPTYDRCITEYHSMVDGRLLRSFSLPRNYGCLDGAVTHGTSAIRAHR